MKFPMSVAPALVLLASTAGLLVLSSRAEDVDTEAPAASALIDGKGPGWVALGKDDFEDVNGGPDTWTWNKDGSIHCTGSPVGVVKSKKSFRNLEIVVEWRHLKAAGNSGVFVWASQESLDNIKGKPGLPHGIEIQVLDHGYTEAFEKSTGKKADWFTTHGDVFPVGAKMTPFPPVSPDGSRSFPTKNLSKGVNEWNHYYIRAVNGEEVSGGTGCEPSEGFLCLESEGSPIEFRNLRIRELP